VPNPGQPTPTPKADLEKILKQVKLPQGFAIEMWAAGVPQAPTTTPARSTASATRSSDGKLCPRPRHNPET
jgi:hypothetical protein